MGCLIATYGMPELALQQRFIELADNLRLELSLMPCGLLLRASQKHMLCVSGLLHRSRNVRIAREESARDTGSDLFI